MRLTYNSLFIRIIIFILASVAITLILLPCISPQGSLSGTVYPLAKSLFSTMCHQLPEKSFLCNELQFLVCARCTGIYLGGFFASLLLLIYPLQYRKIFLRIFVSSLILLFVDVVFSSIGVYNYNLHIAALTGLVAGFSSALIIESQMIRYFAE